MSVLLFLLLFVPLSLVLAWWVAERNDRALLIRRTAVAWLVLAPLTAVMNDWMPFAGGGDDESYYELAQPPPSSVAEALDFSRFQGFMEQPGYPALLSLMNALVGHDLLCYKLLNVFFFITLSIVWYRIGLVLNGRAFARAASLAVLLLTPLWYSVFFILKDMVITLLQSVFLLGVVQAWSRVRFVPLFLIALTSLCVILFRSALVVQQAGVLVGTVAARGLAQSRLRGRLVTVVVPILICVVMLIALSNRELLATLGIRSESRVLSESMLDSAATRRGGTAVSTMLFPLLYLFTETAGLNPRAWARLDPFWLRGVLALPWIVVAVPGFLLGIHHLCSAPAVPSTARAKHQSWIRRLRLSKALATPWSAVLIFVVSYFAISWSVGDTTRWRVPDMPMFAAIAVVGWMNTGHARRTRVLIWWTILLGALFGAFYLLRGM